MQLNGRAWAIARRDHPSEVIELVAHERGLARERVHLSQRLLQDLGMDGDDAVDCFNSVHEQFGTDLTTSTSIGMNTSGQRGFRAGMDWP